MPQYQKSVHKARFAEARANIKTLANALAACKLSGKEWCDIRDLDVSLGTVNGGGYAETDNFMYDAYYYSPTGTFYVNAAYQRDNVCLCYLPDETEDQWVLGENVCGGKDYEYGADPKYDYSQLLGVPSKPDKCACC